jgi:outer membrane immunogenic protein
MHMADAGRTIADMVTELVTSGTLFLGTAEQAVTRGVMKTVLLAGVALFALSSAASAADLALRGSYVPEMAPTSDWTGIYAGVQGGGVAGGDFRFRDATPGMVAPISAQASVGGFVAGGTVGYNWQWGSIVLGIEGDLSYADFGNRLSIGMPGLGTGFVEAKAEGFVGTATARIGYSWDRALVYAKGGYAYLGEAAFRAGATGIPTASRSTEMDGWTVGGGLEYAVSNNLTAKLEYQYLKFSRRTINLAAAPAVLPVSAELDGHLVKAGLNWHFDPFMGH